MITSPPDPSISQPTGTPVVTLCREHTTRKPAAPSGKDPCSSTRQHVHTATQRTRCRGRSKRPSFAARMAHTSTSRPKQPFQFSMGMCMDARASGLRSSCESVFAPPVTTSATFQTTPAVVTTKLCGCYHLKFSKDAPMYLGNIATMQVVRLVVEVALGEAFSALLPIGSVPTALPLRSPA